MKPWQKLILILCTTALVIWAMRKGWGGAAGLQLPATASAWISEAGASNRKLVILITGSTWCPPCQEMERTILASAPWKEFIASEVLFHELDYAADGPPATPLHRQMLELPGLRGFPTMVVADPKGKILDLRPGLSGDTASYIAWIRGLR